MLYEPETGCALEGPVDGKDLLVVRKTRHHLVTQRVGPGICGQGRRDRRCLSDPAVGGEIPRELAAGRIHLGVTGIDLVHEKLPRWEQQVEEVSQLGFGKADLIIAIPACWVDVDTLDDLDAAAAAFRKTHGHRLRIATKYHRLVREFLTDAGVADYTLVDSQGATEGTVMNETAEAIADITSTGETLRANHLKILSDGLILQSQATLWRSRVAKYDPTEKAVLSELLDRLR